MVCLEETDPEIGIQRYGTGGVWESVLLLLSSALPHLLQRSG